MVTAVSSPPVDTSKVSGRRKLKFTCCDDVLADCERLLAGYRRLGNWSLGKMADHLAVAYKLGLDPSTIRVPWMMRFVARNVFKKKALQKMSPGFKLPKAAAQLEPNETEDRAGVEKLRQIVGRWKQQPERLDHPFFGKLTPAEWDQLMLRHAEMHLSFLLPEAA
ncbi:MAG TPA: DUF1569 domain-containing protein [Pirellulales bacterium]|jgi:hypothetical protein